MHSALKTYSTVRPAKIRNEMRDIRCFTYYGDSKIGGVVAFCGTEVRKVRDGTDYLQGTYEKVSGMAPPKNASKTAQGMFRLKKPAQTADRGRMSIVTNKIKEVSRATPEIFMPKPVSLGAQFLTPWEGVE